MCVKHGQSKQLSRHSKTRSIDTKQYYLWSHKTHSANSYSRTNPNELVTNQPRLQRWCSDQLPSNLRLITVEIYRRIWCGWHSWSNAPVSKVPLWLLCASLRSSWSPTSAICQMSSTVSSTCSRDPAVDSEQFRRDLKTYLFAGHL